MISATVPRSPPQTYSRLFRPWDGRTNQDNTVTSTSSTNNSAKISGQSEMLNIDNQLSDMEKIVEKSQRISVISEYELQKPALEKNVPNFMPINNTLCDSKIVDPAIMYASGNPMETSAFYPTYPEFMISAAGGGPYVGMDPFTIGAMEQEYARVLAEEAQAKILSSRKQRPKKFKCPHCDVAFSNNGQLKGHIRIHTGERPFKCDDSNCGKTFTRNEELTRHKRIHTGLRPYACATCGKRFGRRDHLKKHTKTHFVQERYLSPAVFLPMYPYLYGY